MGAQSEHIRTRHIAEILRRDPLSCVATVTDETDVGQLEKTCALLRKRATQGAGAF